MLLTPTATHTANPITDQKNNEPSSSSAGAEAAPIFDPAFGIRISNPKITLDTVNNFCSGMRKLRLGNLTPSRVQTQQQDGEEWLTMGVMVERTGYKKSANGNEYMIWRLSDLTELNAITVKLLLFGDCVKEHWKLQLGNTILLSNPQYAEQTTSSATNAARSNEVTLKVSKPGQVIEIGFCPDFGQCQGRKASDGEQCSHFVNKSRSLYCPFHIQQHARQVAANRGTLNRSGNLPPKQLRRINEPKSIGSRRDEEALPPGLMTVSRRQQQKGNEENSKLYTKPISMLQRGVKRNNSAATSQLEADELQKRSEEMAKLIAENPDNLGAKNLRIMRVNRENADPKGQAKRPINSTAADKKLPSMRDFIQSQVKKRSPMNEIGTNGSSQPSQTAAAILATGKMNASEQREQMKIKRAAEVFKNDAKRPKLSKSESNPTEGTQKHQNGDAPTASRGSLFGAAFTDEQIRALLDKKSTHEAEADEEELRRQNAYFERSAIEEQIETNATSLMEIKGCKVVTCAKCDYTSAHQSAYCRIQGHQVQRHLADKQFFKCTGCQRRVVSYERIMPSKPCLNCKGTKFCRVAMRDERKVILEQEKLKIKEEEKNFGSTVH